MSWHRATVSAALALAMLAVSVGAYNAVGLLRGGGASVQRPSSSLVSLPGTLYLAQGGAIYRLRGRSFKQITPDAGWAQPAVSADGKRLVAVKRSANSSDLYLLDVNGGVLAQLTHNSARRADLNHWAFYPHFSPDGSTVFYSYDPKDPRNTFRVDLAIFSRPANPPSSTSDAIGWTAPNEYTGGDVDPIPVNGALIFTRYSIDELSQVHSQVWLQARPGSPGVALTAPGDDCAQPAVSRDERRLAMICRHGELRSAELEVAPLDPSSGSIGTPTLLVKGELLASPTFSPDGSSVAFLAPAPPGGPFQLWTAPASPQAGSPRQITQNLGFDSGSAPVWVAS
jgi:Tol biopolymer transport system component